MTSRYLSTLNCDLIMFFVFVCLINLHRQYKMKFDTIDFFQLLTSGPLLRHTVFGNGFIICLTHRNVLFFLFLSFILNYLFLSLLSTSKLELIPLKN